MHPPSTATSAWAATCSLLRSAGLLALLPLWTPTPAAQGLGFTPPQFLPGDAADGTTDGHQQEVDIAASDDGFLAVWSDGRSCLDDWQGLTGSGFDVYAALLDANGDVLLRSIVIDEGPGNQIHPHVAWNGQHWLVAWIEQDPTGLPTYDRIRAVRVSPDGIVVDAAPILLHGNDYYFSFEGLAMAGGGADGWTVIFEGNGTGLRAVRVAADGTVATPVDGLVVSTQNVTDWDIAFAQDEYLIGAKFASGGASRAYRYTPTLQPLGSTTLPFFDEVATDGTDFLVVDTNDNLWPPPLQALLLNHQGQVAVPAFTIQTGTAVTSPSGEGVGFDGTNYVVTWNTSNAARVSTGGQLLDPEGGFAYTPVTSSFSKPAYDAAPGGGLQFLWHDGGSGAGNPMDAWTGRLTQAGSLDGQAPASVSAPAQVETSLAQGPAGTNVIVFRSRASGAARILAQRIDDTGLALDPEPIEVATGPLQWLQTPTIDRPDVAWNGSVFLITWSDTVDVFARRMNPDGSFVDAGPITVMPGQHAAVGALGSDFLVAGSTVGTLLATGALRVARLDGTSGAVLDAPPTTLSTPTLAGQFPHIVALGGRWLVVWESVYRDPWSTTVIESTGYAFVEPNGATTGELDAGLGLRPGVAIANDRALLVAVDDTVSGGTTDLDGRILMADGTFLGPAFLLSSAPEEQLAPAAAWNGAEFVVAWEDKRDAVIYFDDRTDVYGARVTASGQVLDPNGVALVTGPRSETAPAFLSVGNTVLLATSILRSDTPLGSFRIGLQRSDGGPVVCQTDLGFGGPGSAVLQMCGDPLATGGTADLLLTGAPPASLTWLVVGTSASPAPYFGGLVVPVPPTAIYLYSTDALGKLLLPDLQGGAGPITFYAQAVLLDAGLPLGFAISNALQLDFLP